MHRMEISASSSNHWIKRHFPRLRRMKNSKPIYTTCTKNPCQLPSMLIMVAKRTYDLGPTDYSLAPYYDQEEDTIAVYYPKGETIYCDRPRKVVVTIGCGDNVPQDDRDTNRDKGECNYIAKVYTRAICPILEELDKSITKPKRDKSLDDKTLCYSQESCSSADKKDLKDMPRKCKKSSDVFKLTKGSTVPKGSNCLARKRAMSHHFS